MQTFLSRFGDPDVMLALSPEELAGALLARLKTMRESGTLNQGLIHLGNLVNDLGRAMGATAAAFAPKEGQVTLAVCEAFALLEAQALVVRAPDQLGSDWRTLSRRAEAMNTTEDFEKYRAARLLPRELLHHSIADAVWTSFVRGEYDTAVFQAMRHVEIATREASGADADWPGVKMARWAFKPLEGPLTDKESEAGEQQGMMDLFAGALGALKNPHSHRIVNFRSPAEAAAVIIFASQLLRIVENAKLRNELFS
jgi:uncharacterized protein (TIGR02391 family)